MAGRWRVRDATGQAKATDSDGLVWNVIRGTGVPTDSRVAKLEQKLEEVKRLCLARLLDLWGLCFFRQNP